MTPYQPTESKNPVPNGTVPVRPVPPDEISPKAVLRQIMGLRGVAARNWKIVLLLILGGALIGFVNDQINKKRPLYSANIVFNLGGSSTTNFGEMGALAGALGQYFCGR
jgi:hypothetical protein